MAICTSEHKDYWGTLYQCEREEDHKGDHEQAYEDNYKGRVEWRLAQWSVTGGGFSSAALSRYNETCVECTSRMSDGEAVEGVCRMCRMLEDIYQTYLRGGAFVYKGVAYFKHHENSPRGGFGNKKFEIRYPDGTTSINQLVHWGTVVPWYRERMPDTAEILGSYF